MASPISAENFIFSSTTACLPPPNEKERTKWIRLPFLGSPSFLLAKEFRRQGYRVAFYPLSSVASLSKLKDKIPTEELSGIYKLNCTSCEAEYYGQTGRSLEFRLKEHRRDFNNLWDGVEKRPRHTLSAMALHCLQNNHHFDDVNSTLIHRQQKSNALNALEQYEILNATKNAESTGKSVLNDMNHTLTSPFLNYYLNSPSTSF